MALRQGVQREPTRLDNEFALGRIAADIELARDIVRQKPEFENALLGVPAFVDIGQARRHDVNAGFLESLPLGGAGQFLIAMDATTGRDPKVMLAGLPMADEQELAVAQHQCAAGNAMDHHAAPKLMR